MYQLPRDPQLDGLARAALAAIRGPNIQMPRLRMPAGIPTSNSRYNVYSDSWL
jgi:hypothetical protein